MKIFKNKSKSGYEYYTTSFYNKDQGGNVLKKSVFVRFQRGTEPVDSADYDFELKAYVNGKEYDVILDAYDNNGSIEGRLFMGQFRKPEIKHQSNDFVPETMNEYLDKDVEEHSEQLDLSSEALPFY